MPLPAVITLAVAKLGTVEIVVFGLLFWLLLAGLVARRRRGR